MRTICLASLAFVLLMATTAMAGEDVAAAKTDQQKVSPWIPAPADARIETMEDIPLSLMHKEPEKYVGTIIEDRFKYYHTYHSKEDAKPGAREQVIVGKTHFTARPVMQPTQMIMIQITPAQDAWISEKGIQRQDVVKAKVRFAGVAPGGALAFDLLEIEGSVRSWLLHPPGEKKVEQH